MSSFEHSPRFSEAMSVDVNDGSGDIKLRLRAGENSGASTNILSPTFNTPVDSSPNVAMVEEESPMMAASTESANQHATVTSNPSPGCNVTHNIWLVPGMQKMVKNISASTAIGSINSGIDQSSPNVQSI